MTADYLKTDRVLRLELVAAILYGRDETGRPRRGWQAAMARDLKVRRATLTETLDSDAETSIFDRRLGDHIENVIVPQRTIELEALREAAAEMQKAIVGLAEMQSLMTKYGFEFTPMDQFKPAKKTRNTKKKEPK